MRELTDIIRYGAFDTYRELEETVEEKLATYKITTEEWDQFFEQRKVVRRVEQADARGILLEDLAGQLGLLQQDLIEQLRVIGAEKGKDGRFRLPVELRERSRDYQEFIKEHLRSLGAVKDEDGRFRSRHS